VHVDSVFVHEVKELSIFCIEEEEVLVDSEMLSSMGWDSSCGTRENVFPSPTLTTRRLALLDRGRGLEEEDPVAELTICEGLCVNDAKVLLDVADG
jgi:hypothetical protein